MVMRKIILIFMALLFVCILHAQNADPSKDKQVFQPDSLLIDSLRTEFTEAEEDTHIVVMPIEELEEYIVSLQDTFFSHNSKSLATDEYYTFGNSHYVVPDHKGSIGIFGARFDNYMQPKDVFYPLMNYYVMNSQDGVYDFTPLQNSFRALLTDVQYSNGDFNNENKSISFLKNEFVNFVDFQLYAHSGEHTSSWGHKCYFDNFVFQLQKKVMIESYTTHRFNYNFLKLFSASETYNVFNPNYGISADEQYLQKNETILNLFDAFFFDDVIHFSYLNQFGEERIYDKTTHKAENTIVRHQFNLDFDLSLEEYATKVLLRADLQDIDHFYWKGYLHDYLIHVSINSPGIFADFYSLQIVNDVIFSEKPDTIFIMPELVFDIPITKSINSELSVGARRKEKNFYYDGIYALDNRTKVIFSNAELSYENENTRISLGAFYDEIRRDGQWVLLSGEDSTAYEQLADYKLFGADIDAEFHSNIFGIDNSYRLEGTYTHCPYNLVNCPSYKAKFRWENRKHLPHMNFIFLNAEASYLGNFLDVTGDKVNHQLFCSAEIGVSIKRFLIYLKLTNIFNILDSNYFMYKLNEVNPIGVAFGVQWNFIN
ncbi:hypothetical protein D4R71_02870 [bacterium]|nr:MAG: hypothetical protein D4R71_02870 [bacterium]